MGILSIEQLGLLLLVCIIGIVLGGVAVLVRHRSLSAPAVAGGNASAADPSDSSRQEVKRYFLLNETGNVLIATSLDPGDRLPDATLALFSEALSHLSAVFFAIAGTKDQKTNEPFSLYNYSVLKRALAAHPVFIRVASEKSPTNVERASKITPIMFSVQPLKEKTPEQIEMERKRWMDERIRGSRHAFGMEENGENITKLKAIHAQMRAEAERINKKRLSAPGADFNRVLLLKSTDSHPQSIDVDEEEIGHVTLYCECLMGVSLVSVKLAHAHFQSYLYASEMQMEYDTYLFVSPAQLRKTITDLNNLPHARLPH